MLELKVIKVWENNGSFPYNPGKIYVETSDGKEIVEMCLECDEGEKVKREIRFNNFPSFNLKDNIEYPGMDAEFVLNPYEFYIRVGGKSNPISIFRLGLNLASKRFKAGDKVYKFYVNDVSHSGLDMKIDVQIVEVKK